MSIVKKCLRFMLIFAMLCPYQSIRALFVSGVLPLISRIIFIPFYACAPQISLNPPELPDRKKPFGEKLGLSPKGFYSAYILLPTYHPSVQPDYCQQLASIAASMYSARIISKSEKSPACPPAYPRSESAWRRYYRNQNYKWGPPPQNQARYC